MNHWSKAAEKKKISSSCNDCFWTFLMLMRCLLLISRPVLNIYWACNVQSIPHQTVLTCCGVTFIYCYCFECSFFFFNLVKIQTALKTYPWDANLASSHHKTTSCSLISFFSLQLTVYSSSHRLRVFFCCGTFHTTLPIRLCFC